MVQLNQLVDAAAIRTIIIVFEKCRKDTSQLAGTTRVAMSE